MPTRSQRHLYEIQGTTSGGDENPDIVPMPPTSVALNPKTVAAAAPVNTQIGTLSTVDPNPGNTFTYTMGSNPGGLFKITAPNILAVAAALTAGSKSITIVSTDNTGRALTQPFIITVT